MMASSSGKEKCPNYGTCAVTSAQLSCFHFIRESEVFAHIPALESRQHSNGRRVRLLDSASESFPLCVDGSPNVIGKNNYRIQRIRTSSTYPVSGDGNEVRPRPN